MHSAQDTTHIDDDAPVYMGLPHERVLRPRFLVALALTLPVLVLAMGSMAFPHAFHSLPPKLNGWLQLALTTPVFFWSGRFFIGRWWKSLRELDTNMFTLTVTGTGAAYFYSVFAVLFGDHFPASLHLQSHGVPLYFEAAAFITTIVLLGQILEQRAHARTDGAGRDEHDFLAGLPQRRHLPDELLELRGINQLLAVGQHARAEFHDDAGGGFEDVTMHAGEVREYPARGKC